MSSLRRLFPGLFTDLQRPTFGTQRLARDQTDIGPLLRGLNNALYQSATLPDDINALLGAAASPEGRQALSQGLLTTGGDFLTALGELTREGTIFKHLGRPDLLSSLADVAADNPPDVTDLLPGGPALGMVGTAGRGALLKRLAKAQATPGKEATQFFGRRQAELAPQTSAVIEKRAQPLRRQVQKMGDKLSKERYRLARIAMGADPAGYDQAKARLSAMEDHYYRLQDELNRLEGAPGASKNIDKQFDTIQSIVQSLPGLPPEELARLDRAVQQGFTVPGFHATKGDITAFDPGLLGTTTQANSARLGFFFAADKQTPQSYFKFARKDVLDKVRPEARRPIRDLEHESQLLQLRQNDVLNAQFVERKELSRQINEEASMRQILAQANISPDDFETHLVELAAEAARRWGKGAEKGPLGPDPLLRQIDSATSGRVHEFLMDFYHRNRDLEREFHQLDTRINTFTADVDRMSREIDEPSAFGSIMPVFLKMDNPKVIEFNGGTYRDISYSKALKEAQAEGHDSAIFRNTMDGGPVTDVYIVFDPGQIRSTKAAFDPAQAPQGIATEQERVKRMRELTNRRREMEAEMGFEKARQTDEYAALRAEAVRLIDLREQLIQGRSPTHYKTSDVLASGAPILYPLGMGAAAEAYLANKEDR